MPGAGLTTIAPMTIEIRQVTPEDDEVSEEWGRETDEQILGVSACRIDWLGVWHVVVAAQEFFRQDQLGLELRQRVQRAMELVPDVTGVTENDNETWHVTGSPFGEALVRAVASVLDDLAERMRDWRPPSVPPGR
jgi:hypothetical protein